MLQPGDHDLELTVGKLERTYIVHVPPSYDQAQPTPLILAFHGGGSNADAMVSFSGLNEKSDAAGFICVYPRGSGRLPRAGTWNAGNCCGYAERHKVDEVAFVSALLDDLARRANIDPRRIFATGMSNGAMMSYLLADKLSRRIAAIAPVGGPMGLATCQPDRPVPVIHMHGTLDKFAPFAGGVGDRSISRTNFYSVQHSINAWVDANGCQPTPQVEELPNQVDDGTSITRYIYRGGRHGSEVILLKIHGGGHTWPGHESDYDFLGPSTGNIDANDVMWEFFQQHPLPK